MTSTTVYSLSLNSQTSDQFELFRPLGATPTAFSFCRRTPSAFLFTDILHCIYISVKKCNYHSIQATIRNIFNILIKITIKSFANSDKSGIIQSNYRLNGIVCVAKSKKQIRKTVVSELINCELSQIVLKGLFLWLKK